MLLAATLVWGGSFVVTRQAVQGVAPLVFVAARFGIAALTVGGVARPGLSRLTRMELWGGAAIGAAMLGGYGLQAVGMSMGVSAGRAAFISAIYVPIVPVLQMILLRRLPGLSDWMALALAFAGLLLLAGRAGGTSPGRPELLVLCGAFAIAAEIVLIGVFANRVDPRRLAMVECGLLSAACLAVSALCGTSWPAPARGWIGAAVLLGVGSAGLQVAVNWAQRYVPPARATLIYTLEPVWAATFGLFIGERMGPGSLAGAALILASLVIGGLQKEAQHGF